MLPHGRAFHFLLTTTTSCTISCQPPSFLPTSPAMSLTSTRALSKRNGQFRPVPVISGPDFVSRSEEHTSELQSRGHLVCRLLLEKKKNLTRRSRPEAS